MPDTNQAPAAGAWPLLGEFLKLQAECQHVRSLWATLHAVAVRDVHQATPTALRLQHLATVQQGFDLFAASNDKLQRMLCDRLRELGNPVELFSDDPAAGAATDRRAG